MEYLRGVQRGLGVCALTALALASEKSFEKSSSVSVGDFRRIAGRASDPEVGIASDAYESGIQPSR